MSGENRYLTLDDVPPLPSYCAARLAEIHRHEYSGETPCIINGHTLLSICGDIGVNIISFVYL